MPTRDEILASEMIAARLRDPFYQDQIAIGNTRDTGHSDQLAQDTLNLSPVEFVDKYGRDAHNQRWRVLQGFNRIGQIDDGERSTGEILTDSTTGAAGAAYRTFGNLSGLGAGALVDWVTDGEITREQATADILSQHNQNVEAFLQTNLTEQLQERQRLFGIEGQLDEIDNQVQYETEIAEGEDPFYAALRREGRNALNSVERAWNSPDVTGQIISEGIGDLALSVPLAGAGGLIAKGATSMMVRNILAKRVILASGTSAGAGITEVTGVYAEAVQDVLSIPIERLAETSTIFQALVAEGNTPEEARSQLAGMTAETAALRQLVPSFALGFITSRFERMPIGSFRGVGVAKGMLQIAGEGLEEAGQGISGTINRNLAVEDYAQIGRDTLDGVGEEAALGAIAGVGVAGVMTTPATTIGAAQRAVDAANALFSETQYNDPLKAAILGTASPASRAASAVNEATRPVRKAVINLGSRVAQTFGNTVAGYVNRASSKEVSESIQATIDATESIREIAAKGQLRDDVQAAFDFPDTEIASEGFADVTGGDRNVFDNITGIVSKIGAKGFKPVDADIAYAASQLVKIQGMIASMPKQAQREYGKVISSKLVQTILSKAQDIDLNKEGASNDVNTVLYVAKVNPTGLDPDAADQILEESGEDISPEDVKLTKVASKLARIVNRRRDSDIRISRDQNINLTASGRKPGKEKTVANVSRQIFVDGFVTEGGRKLRSINDFAREIFIGIQSPDGTVINQEGRVQPVSDVMKDFQNFAQHMINKVTALNESVADGYTDKQGKRGSKIKNFDSPVRGVRREGVRYSPDNPDSVAFAQQVAEDQNAVIDAFNTLRTEFPDQFGSFPEMQKVVLTPATQIKTETKREDKQQEQPTAIDEVSSQETEEQKKQEEITIEAPDITVDDQNYIIDDDGDPVTFYHGTNKEFSEFQDGRIFLTTRKGLAREFAKGDGTGTPRLMSMNVKLANPLVQEVPDDINLQNFWLVNTLTLEQKKADGHHDAIFLFKDEEGLIIAKTNNQIEILNSDVDGTLSDNQKIELENPTAIEEEVTLEENETENETEATAEGEAEVEVSSKVISDEQIQERQEYVRKCIRSARNYIKERMSFFNKYVRIIHITFKDDSLGHAYFKEKKIDIHNIGFNSDGTLNALGRATLIHETAHLVDNHDNPIGVPYSSARNFYKGGKIFNEMKALRGNLSKYFNSRLEYAFSYSTPEIIASELFAVASEMAFSTEVIDGSLEETATLMEYVYGDLIKTETTGTTSEISETEVQSTEREQVTEEPDGGEHDKRETDKSSTIQVSEQFTSNFKERKGDAPVEDVSQVYARPELNENYKEILKELMPSFIKAMNARLQRKVKDGKVKKTVAQHFKDGRGVFRRFKAAALINPETEEYDPKILEMAAVAVMDFIATANASDPRRLEDTLEKMGLSILDMTEEGIEKVLFGLPPSQVSDILADDLKRLWNVSEDETKPVDDLEGITHGFVKEILTVLAQMNIIDIDTVKVSNEANRRDAVTILVNTEKMKEYQHRMNSTKGEGVKNTVREVIFGDAQNVYSIGTPPKTIQKRKGRGTGILSAIERKTVRNMQNIPFRKLPSRWKLLQAIGEDNLATMLGFKDISSVTHPILKRSVLGKNASIRHNMIEVSELGMSMDILESDTVFFPVGVTKVGRHQMQGPNPQNNKLMRFFVAPQRSTLSTTGEEDTRKFWLGVTQQAGLFKAEKKDHATHLRAAFEEFRTKYGVAVNMVKTLIETGEFDSDAFLAEVGQVGPEVLGAIDAVATRTLAIERGDETFETPLSFELDGVTNGAANMMINFGHGLLTLEEWNNFKRVGYFLGETKQTLTQFFNKDGKGKEKDLYEKVSWLGDKMMTGDLKFLNPWQKQQRMAAGRLATVFGDFEMDENGYFQMTRDTAKNPMTKVNYGSGVQGVAIKIADNMLLDFYQKLQDIPKNADWNTYFYPGVVKDMATLGLKLPRNFNKDFVFPRNQVEDFRKSIQFTIGKVLTDATRETLGHRITELSDMLVMSTNLQSKYLQKLFDKEIQILGNRLADEGVIGKKKNGKPNTGQIPRFYFKEIEDRLGKMGAIFVSDEQTLAVSGNEKKLTDLRLSSNFDEQLNTPARMRRPDDIRVRGLPFIVIGTGDAMVMNLFFGEDGAPNDVLPVFDGADVPVGKIYGYAARINEAVLKSWDRDVLGMVTQNFDGFLSNDLDEDLLAEVWLELKRDNKKESLSFFQSPEDLQNELTKRVKENRARKKVFRTLARSVDQMGGSDVGFSQEGEELSLTEINHRIEKEINKDTHPKDVRTPLRTTNAKAILNNMRGITAAQKKAVGILKPLMGDVVVHLGTLDQLNEFRKENYPDDGVVLKAPSQYDFKNNVMFMSTDTNESMLHEMVHAATYGKVLEHYQGVHNPAVARLEILMQEFMDIDSKGKGMNEAQAAIARRMARNDPINQAAAVNEFMAYVLTHSRVRAKAKQTNVLADFGSKVMNLLRRILGGMPASLYDHVVFNTRILNEPNADDGGNGGDIPPDDEGPESTGPFQKHSDYWIENLKDYMRSFTQDSPKKQKTGRDILNADRVIDALRQGGLLANSKDRSTFKAIYGIILSDMNLDANARIALTRVFEHVIENMTPDMFGSTPEDHQIYSAVLNSFGAITNKNMSDAAAVFFALSQTSKKFRNVIDQIPAPEGQAAVEGSLNQFATKVASFSMKKLMGSLDTEKVPQDVLDTIAKIIIDHDKEKEYRILRRVTSSLTAADDYVSGKLSASSDWMQRKNAKVQNESRKRAIPFLLNAVTMGTNLLNKTNSNLMAQEAKKITHMGLPILSIVPIREMVSETVGTDKQNSVVVNMLNMVNSAISGLRQAYREDLPGILEKEFKEAPTKEQWKSMYHTLAKTDFSVLVNLDNMQKSMKFLEESAVRKNEIKRLEALLGTRLNASNLSDALEKAQQLSDFMNGYAVGKLLARNPYTIAKNLDGDVGKDVVNTLDRLISLYALERMDPQIREETIRLWQDDPKGITSIIAYIQGLNEAEETKPGISEQARLNGFKGYIPNEGRDNVQIIIDLETKEDALARKGYKKLDTFYKGETDSVFPRSYYISTVRRQGMYSQGVMQNVAITYRGVDTNTGLTVNNSVAGLITGDSSIDRIVKDQLNPNTVLENPKEALMPVFASDGTVFGFERAVSSEIQELHFGRDENLAVMLGAWAGRQVEESLADQYNKQLVDELHRIWKNREKGTDAEFEDMKSSNDKIYQESWKLIPRSTKTYIERKFDDGFMIPRSMINLSVGYREPSITDMWSGKTRLPDTVQKTVIAVTEGLMGRNAMRWLSTGEEALQGTVSTAKDIIVIRSLIVPVANTQANVVQLTNAGVPIKNITKGFRIKLAESEEFVKNRTKIIDLEQKLKIARNSNQRQIIKDKIQVLEDLNQQMSIAPMIEAGQFKNLSEGITDLDVHITSGRISEYLDKLADKLPDIAADITKVGLVSKSTKMYQALNRATQYGDFIAKSIYYDHLISQGVNPDIAIAMINEEFVNYSTLPGRVRSGLEANGLTWFMAFKIRILKIAAKQLRDNPVRSLAINSVIDVGGPVPDNILSVIGEGRLDYSTGFEMMFDAPELNPWINLLSD